VTAVATTAVGRVRRARHIAFGPQRFPKVVFVGVVATGLVIAVLNPRFLTYGNFANMGQTAALVGIAAVAQTIVLIGRGFDLSIGAIGAFCGLAVAELLNAGVPPAVAVVGAVVSGAVLGLINGFLVAIVKLNTIIATLGTSSVYYGLVLLYTEGVPEVFPNDDLSLFVTKPFDMAATFWCYVIIMVLAGIALHFTVWGWRLFAVGASPEAAQSRGINVTAIRVSSFVASGLLAGFAGVLAAAEFGSAQPAAGRSWLLISIAGPVLGGVSVVGGSGTIFGCFLGIVLVTEIGNGLVLAGMTSYSREFALGVAIVLAMTIQSDPLREAVHSLRRRYKSYGSRGEFLDRGD
jgi:ribose/xylose/arabinose/galactoside ABC-type transport system permease subunit